MARMCEQGSLSQPDTIVGQTVFTGSIESLKIGVALLIDQGLAASQTVVAAEGKLVESPAAPGDSVLLSEASVMDDGAPVSQELVITNV